MVFLTGSLFLQAKADAEQFDRANSKYKDTKKLINKSSYCLECHQDETPGIVEEWLKSTHARAGIGCADCHATEKEGDGAFLHAKKFYVRTVVTPVHCAKCHKDIQRDYFTSGHARSLDLLTEMKEDDPRYPVVSQYSENDFQQCSGCHGGEVKLDERLRPDPATWPDHGAGRINPNTTHGTCTSCHLGHRFSSAAARQPETCLRCHDGPNYPEGDIYRSSAHGIAYATQTDKKDMERPGFFFDGKLMVSPTCAFCHLNGSGHGLLTRHNEAWRLPRDLTSPKAPMAPKNADNLRNNMKSVCNQCHASTVIDRFFDNADKKLEEYQKSHVEPKLAEYQQLLASAGENNGQLLKDYSRFLAESKRYRMSLYMGSHSRTQR